MAFPLNTSPIDAQEFNENWDPVRSSTQQVDFYAAAVEFGFPTTNIQMCAFYSNGCPGVIPPTPTGMLATLSSGLLFNLSWNLSAGATSYKVYRDDVYNKTVTGISTTASGVLYSTEYCWKVTAVNVEGESAKSTASCATTSTSAGYTEFEMGFFNYITQTDACDGSILPDDSIMRYHDGVGTYPTSGDKIYNTDTAGDVFVGGGSWYWDVSGKTYQVSNTGIISNVTIC